MGLDITLNLIWYSEMQKLLNRPKVEDRPVAWNLNQEPSAENRQTCMRMYQTQYSPLYINILAP